MKYDIYLAGPFFTEKQKVVMAKAKRILQEEGFDVCDPQELSPVIVDLPPEERNEKLFKTIYERNIEAIRASNYMIACIDDRDVGTAFEIGFFIAENERWQLFTFSAMGYGSNVMIAQATGGHAEDLDDVRGLIVPAIRNGGTFKKAARSEE